MAEDKNFYKDIIDNLYDGVYFVNRDRVITYWNKGAERITGYSSTQAVGRPCQDNLLNHVTGSGVPLCMNHCPLAAVMEDGREREVEIFLSHAQGHRLPVAVRATALRDETGKIVGAVETFSNNINVVNTRRELREMHQVALTDALTGIGNRRLLDGRLRAAIAEFQNNTGHAGLLMMDVDHFKEFNDVYGHNTGDSVLRMVAQTMRYALRATDTTGRWGGEEFVAILHDIRDEDDLQAAAEKVRALVEHSRLNVDGQILTVTVSIGGTLLLAGDTPLSLINRADQLMYRSKEAGRNQVIIG